MPSCAQDSKKKEIGTQYLAWLILCYYIFVWISKIIHFLMSVLIQKFGDIEVIFGLKFSIVFEFPNDGLLIPTSSPKAFSLVTLLPA